MIGNAGRSRLDDPDVGIDLAQNIPADRAGEKSVDHALEGAGDVVFPVKLGFVKDGDKDVFRQDVLDDHLPNVGHDDVGIDRIMAEFQKILPSPGESGVLRSLVLNQFAQLHGQIGEVLFKTVDGIPEGSDFSGFIVYERRQQAVKCGVVAEGSALQFLSVLNENGGFAVFKEDVGRGVSLDELFPYLFIQRIVGIFALPISPVLTERVFERTIRVNGLSMGGSIFQLQDQLDLLVRAVLFDEFLEGGADGGFVAGPSVPHDFLNLVVVLLDQEQRHLMKRPQRFFQIFLKFMQGIYSGQNVAAGELPTAATPRGYSSDSRAFVDSISGERPAMTGTPGRSRGGIPPAIS
ncbi:MAG: hypothetical protein A4E68_01192 [Syntrophaceae bacterium PtaB.Bin095]|nr:MAG: hypothetical protein A4E68_01192 [Syntrophaceae bacterium PtaB.Bin095]